MKIIKSLLSIIMAILIFFSFVGCGNDFVNEAYFSHIDKSSTTSQNYKEISEKCLKIYFLSVGQADSMLILSSGKAMLIDGGNTDDGEYISQFLKSLNISKIDVLVGTHAHEDHIGGLSTIVEDFKIGRAIVSTCGRETTYYKKYINTLNKKGVTEEPAHLGEKFNFGDTTVQIIGPISEYEDDLNNTSVVLRMTYGKRSVLFTGDCSKTEENDILSAGYNVSADVLKVGHHGSNTSSCYTFLREVMPKYAVIEVGQNNEYSLPNENALSRFRDVGATIYRTDQMGTITCTITEMGEISFITEEESNFDSESEKVKSEKTEVSEDGIDEELVTEKEPIIYIGNKNSKKFHKSDCRYVPKESNQIEFASRQEAIDDEYTPCSYCNP